MTRAGFVAVIGAPNAGKSTLVNRLVGTKVSIVTRKVQTTRFVVRGLAIEGDTQIVLVDTPGIFDPRRRLDRAMVRAAWKGADDAEAIVHVIDAEAQDHVLSAEARSADWLAVKDAEAIRNRLKASGRKSILAINKIDRVKKERLLTLIDGLFDNEVYEEVFLISATGGAGVKDLKRRLADRMPAGPWLYPEDQSADIPLRLLAAEITREKLYLRVHDEIPYGAAVETTQYEERTDGSVRIEQTIYVERDGQRGILVGKGGATLKWIGQAARQELSDLLGRPAHLFLHVKVRAGWSEDRSLYQDVGLDFDV
ncbi:MAG TPA: GTPase Era [Caulobacteraceae bacterium]|jgi:GTP-binding protein Era